MALARNLPAVCQDYETEVIKFGVTVLGDTSEAQQGHLDAAATDAAGPYNPSWSDPNWPGQGNPKPPPVIASHSPGEKELLATPRNMGGLAPNPAPTGSAFIEAASEPFPCPNQAECDKGVKVEEDSDLATIKTNAAEAARNIAATHCLHKKIEAMGALGVLKAARDACIDGTYKSQRKGSMTCSEVCDTHYPPSSCDNPYYSACVKGCVGYLDHEVKDYDQFYLAQSGAGRSTSASNGNSLPRDFPTNEHKTDDRFDQHP